MPETPVMSPNDLVNRIVSVRGMRVLLDFDLAALYGVQTRRFNEAVRRNHERFPADFSFMLSDQ